MRTAKTYMFLLASVLLSSCSDEYLEARRTVPLSTFTTIEIHSVFSVYLVQDNFYGVEIVADDDIINSIDASIQGEVLNLVDKRGLKWTSPESNEVKIYVHSPDHGKITAHSTLSPG